jgi:hypothetical protein
MAKLAGTAQTVIMVGFIVMNLEKILSSGLYFLLQLLSRLFSAMQGKLKLASLIPGKKFSQCLTA